MQTVQRLPDSFVFLLPQRKLRSITRPIMSHFKSLKGENPKHIGRDDLSDQCYQAPPGPPLSRFAEAKKYTDGNDCQAPPGPPPSQIPSDNPPPYHDWTSIPDTSLLPPPPSLGHESSKYNAAWDDAARAHAFCDQFPPYTPARPSLAVQQTVRNGDIVVEQPREYAGELKPVAAGGRGVWSAKTRKGCGDCVLLSALVSIDSSLTIAVPSLSVNPLALTLSCESAALIFCSHRVAPPNSATEDHLLRGTGHQYGSRREWYRDRILRKTVSQLASAWMGTSELGCAWR